MAQPDHDRSLEQAQPQRPDRDSNEGLGIGIAADLEQLRRLEPPTEAAERRGQIVSRVLAHPASHVAPVSLRPRRTAVTIAALAATGLVVLWISTEHREPQAASGTQRAAPSLRVASGSIEADGAMLRGDARVAPGTTLRAVAEPAELTLADASLLRAAPSTTFVYTTDREERFALEHGRVSLQVSARARHNPLVVETAELEAWVVGTRFDVARAKQGAFFATTVTVAEGVVRVVAKSKAETRLLAAGEQITVRAVSGPDRKAEPEAQPAPSAKSAAIVERKPAPAGTARAETHAQSALTAEIRRQLREGAVGAARRLIQRAERTRTVSRVELSLLQAEADLAERRYGRAKIRYLTIVAEYAGTPEAELSLFAAAQLSRGQAGVDLLQRYLAHYPDGRFAKEAQRLLEALDLPRAQ